MNKIICVLLALTLCISLASCGEKQAPAASSPTQSASVGSMEQTQSDPEAEDMLARLVHAVAPLGEKYDGKLGEDGKLTDEQGEALLDAVKPFGVPVQIVRPVRGGGIENHQALKDFCEAVTRGENAQTTYYEIYIDGVGENRFDFQDGKLTRSTRLWSCSDDAPNPDRFNETLDGVAFWDNGWMVWYTGDPKSDTVSGSGIRAVALPEELGGLYERYVAGLEHANSNLFSANWDAQSYDVIRWEYLFGALLEREGKALEDYEPTQTPDGYSELYSVPATDAETLLTRYFPVTVEQLRALEQYHADTQTYLFGYFQGSGVFKTGQLEVVDKTENPDGSFTLQLDWVDAEFAAELRGRYCLTILPDDAGGYRYIGNRVDETVQDPFAG